MRALLRRRSPLRVVRRSFRWKLLLTVIGSVSLLAAVTLVVVRRETGRQIETATRVAEERSAQAFLELEEQNREYLSQLSTVFTDSRPLVAAVEAAVEAGDAEALRQDVLYEFDRRRITHERVVAFTDAYGEPVLAMLEGRALAGEDPVNVAGAAERVLYEGEDHIRGYRLVEGRLYSVETLLLELVRPVGTVTVGVPLGDAEVRRVGTVLGAEVCFVAQGRCVAGTARDRPALEEAMISAAGGAARGPHAIGGERWSLGSGSLSPEEDVWWAIALPLAGVEGPLERVQRAVLAGALGALLLATVLGSVLARGLTRPIAELVRATSRVARGDYDTRVEARSADEIGALARAFNQMTHGLALKERYRGVLDKVVSRDIAEELLKGELVLGGENREVTVVFADITGFTSITDGMEPARVIGLLNECMERLTGVVEAEGGVVDKYVGDQIMALFGAPVSRGQDVLRAARAALGMQRAMAEMNVGRRARGEPPLEVSVGMNTGVAMAGNMGSPSRLNYTVLGDAVNLASRVESKAPSGGILITENTWERIADQVEVRDLGPTELRGFAQPVRLYELLALRSGSSQGRSSAASTAASLP